MKSASKGFTLLEIIVVMLIISITSSLVFMNFGRGAGKKDMKIFAEKLSSLCKKARMTSLSSGVPVKLIISPADRQCWISIWKNHAEITGRQDNDKKAYVLSIPGKVFIEASGLTRQDSGVYEIVFYPDGSSSGGDLAIGQGDKPSFFCRIDLLTGVVSMSVKDRTETAL